MTRKQLTNQVETALRDKQEFHTVVLRQLAHGTQRVYYSVMAKAMGYAYTAKTLDSTVNKKFSGIEQFISSLLRRLQAAEHFVEGEAKT